MKYKLSMEMQPSYGFRAGITNATLFIENMNGAGGVVYLSHAEATALYHYMMDMVSNADPEDWHNPDWLAEHSCV